MKNIYDYGNELLEADDFVEIPNPIGPYDYGDELLDAGDFVEIHTPRQAKPLGLNLLVAAVAGAGSVFLTIILTQF